MNLRVFVNPREAECHPFELFCIGVFYSLVSVFISSWLFPDIASLLLIVLTVLGVTPLVYHVVGFESKKRTVHPLRDHRRVFGLFSLLFVGFFVGYLVGFFVFPDSFSAQSDTISLVTGSFGVFASLSAIFLNNVRVLFLCVVSSVIFGSGALLILAWNASILAVAVGSFILAELSSGVVSAVVGSLSRYLLHGVPEIAAYLVGALVGGMVFHAVVRRLFSRQFLFDVVGLLLLSVSLLVLGALLEVFVTPLLL